MFINLSATSLNSQGLADSIREELCEHRTPAAHLGFVITETAAREITPD